MSKIKIYICGGIVVELDEFRILFDPWASCDEKFDVIFISHGHTDHVKGLPFFIDKGINRIYMSKETFLTIQAQGLFDSISLSKLKDKVNYIKIGEELDLRKGISITPFNSGHVIGGLMFRIETNNVSIGYTGDFNFENTMVSDRADILETDILIMDSTYGNPRYIFPPRPLIYETIKETLVELVNEGYLPILHGYSLGKGQELTRLSTLFIDGIIGVDKRVGQFNRIYESSTKKSLGRYSIGGKGKVYIRGIRKYKKKAGNHVHIFFTGWALTKKFKSAISFPLSSHSDFMGLLNYVIENKPKLVYTLFSFARTFSKFIKEDLKINSMPLPRKPTHVELRKSDIEKIRGKFTLDSFL